MKSTYIKLAGLGVLSLLVTGCAGSTLPLVFVERTTAGLDISGPNPAEGETGHIILGFNQKSAAVVPIAVRNDEIVIPLSGKDSAKKLNKITEELDKLLKKKDAPPATVAALSKKKTEAEAELKATTRKRSFVLVQSTDGTKTDALSVLGQFEMNGESGKQKAGVGLGKFFATGSAAKTLAEGFAAKLGAERGAPLANGDSFEVTAGETLSGLSVTANDITPPGTKVALQVAPASGTANLDKNGMLTYTAGSTAGNMSFSYALTNRQGTSSAVVKIIVKAAVAQATKPPASIKGVPLPAPPKS